MIFRYVWHGLEGQMNRQRLQIEWLKLLCGCAFLFFCVIKVKSEQSHLHMRVVGKPGQKKGIYAVGTIVDG